MNNKYSAYEDVAQVHDKSNFSKDLIAIAEKESIPVENDPETLKDLIDMDLRENVPPQVYELISCVVEMIEKVEQK